MTPEQARSILRTVADNPAAMRGQFELFTALDALATVYGQGVDDTMNDRQRALRSPRATWAAVQAHAENRMGAAK